jgi:hypothetical protein
MPYAGITYRVRPGNEDRIAQVFSPENFTRVDSPILRDEEGEELGYLTCTGLFVQDDTMVRVIQHEGGTLADIRRHMSVQPGVHEAENKVMEYLATPRDTETPEGFMRHFDRSTMTMIDHRQIDNRPASGLLALRYVVRPVAVEELTAAWQAATQRLELSEDAGVFALLLLVKDDVVIRVIQHEGGDPTDHLRSVPHRAATDAWLTPYLANPADTDLDIHLARHRMRCISHMSAATTG